MKTINTLPSVLLLCLCLTACGVNPVTGKQELQFVSEASELKIGEQHYAPTRQGEGGDFTLDPALTTYVNGVGQKLAAVSDRKLPYEFVVLNSSVPNAWHHARCFERVGSKRLLSDDFVVLAMSAYPYPHDSVRYFGPERSVM